MAVNILFISEQYIKDTSYIDENVDMKLLRSNIIETQDIRVPHMVGTALYEELKTQINAGTLTALNRTLLDSYISPCLKYWVLHDGAYIFQYKIMNKGIVTRSSENTETIQTGELDRLMDFFKGRAEDYQEKITNYLVENHLSYPLYYNAGNGIDTIHPTETNYTQGWYLGQSDKKCYRKYS
jgi:hypothetical protein